MATFFTFYSFKGGVGRSMAMANVADILARRGLRVLAIDFDLEAPGLERYFQVEKTAALANLGLIDLLQSFKKSLSGAAPMDDAAEFRDLHRFIFPVYQRPLPNGGELHLMTAGQRESASQYRQYALAVRTFDWQDFYFNWEGEAFFEWLRTDLAQAVGSRPPYDVVLVDSRTGVTEMGGVCAYQLSDVIVMLCAANHQNVEGTRAVAQDFRSDTVRALRRGRPLEMVVVPARIEQRDERLLEAFFARFNSFFMDDEPAAFCAAGLSFRDLMIPYQPEYAFEEVVVSDPERRQARRDIGGAFELLANALTLLAGTAADERLGAQREVALAAVQAALAQAATEPTPGAAAAAGEPGEAPTFADLPGDADAAPAPGAAPTSAAATGSTPEFLNLELGLERSLRRVPPIKFKAPAEATTQFDPTRRFAGYDVFLSFGEVDHEAAAQLGTALGAAGYTVFLDTSALTGGEQMAESIAQALHHSRHLLVCSGRRGVAPWQKREIELARSSNQPIRLVPILLVGAEQDIFSLALRGVADLQAIDLRRWPAETAAFQHLVQLLREGNSVRRDDEAAAAKAVNPYAGLDTYDEGRVHLLDLPKAALAELRARLAAGGLAVLMGPSGVGKGSLVTALVAELRQAAGAEGRTLEVLRLDLSDAAAWPHLHLPRPDGQLLVLENLDRQAPGLRAAGAQSLWPAGLAECVAQASATRPLLLVGNDLPLLSWRVPPSPDAALWARLQALTLTLQAPDAAAIRRAIESPTTRSGFAFEPGLLDRVVQDAGTGPGALALGQMVLAQLWPQAARGFLTNAAYDACGGIADLNAAHVDARLAELPANLVTAAHALLLRLAVAADDGSIGWQTTVWEPMRSQGTLAQAGAEALLWLLKARVVVAWRAGPEQLCLSLLRPLASGSFGRLAMVLQSEHGRLVKRRRLMASLGIWRTRQEASDALLAGFRLEEARSLLQDWPGHLSEDEQRFIVRSGRQTVLARRARGAMLAGVGVAMLAATAVGAWNWVQNQRIAAASTQLDEANAAIKVTINQNAGASKAYELDASLFKDLRIYTQYKDARDKDVVNALASALRAYGLRVEPTELVPARATTCGEVRYFVATDAERAAKLQEATGRLLQGLGIEFSPALMDLSLRTELAKTGAGTLELWLPPMRTLGNPATLAQNNPKDTAELRPVPGACATVGSAPETVKALAQKLGQPFIEVFKNDLPRQTLWIDGFQMYRFEVTNEQFARYQAACQAGPACPGQWTARGKPREPARFLSWAQADAYCRWAGARLPTEFEWEKAARGTSGLIWPWGDTSDPSRYQGKETSGGKLLAEVGRFPSGDSPYGVSDMAGNLWELTASTWPDGSHVMKGGSYLNLPMYVRPALRWATNEETRGADYFGFRCAVDLPLPRGQAKS